MGFLSSIINFRDMLENPSVPLSEAGDWFYDALGGHRSSSGIRVNRKTALTYSYVWRAANLISRDVARVPLRLLKVAGETREPDLAHPSYSLLRRKPNTEMTAFIFKQTLMAHVLLEGNGYAYINRLGDGRPAPWQDDGLIPLMPDRTWPVRENGQLFYVTQLPGGGYRKLLKENVLHFKGLGFDGLIGYSVIRKAADSWGLGMGASATARGSSATTPGRASSSKSPRT